MCEMFNLKMSHNFVFQFFSPFAYSLRIGYTQNEWYYLNLGCAKTKVHTIRWQVIKFFIACFRCSKHMFEIRSASTIFNYDVSA